MTIMVQCRHVCDVLISVCPHVPERLTIAAALSRQSWFENPGLHLHGSTPEYSNLRLNLLSFFYFTQLFTAGS